MANFKLSKEAKDDLIRIHHCGIDRSGVRQADKYFDSFFEYLEIIAKNPFSFEAVDYIRKGYPKCACGVDTIYFRLNEDFVEIMAIVGKQDLKDLF